MRGSAISAVAALCALSAFAVSVMAGLWAGVSPDRVLVRALGAMLLCYLLGHLIGWAARWVIEDQLARGAGAESALPKMNGESVAVRTAPDDADKEIMVV